MRCARRWRFWLWPRETRPRAAFATDVTGFPLEVAHTASTDVSCRFRPRDGETVQAAYLTELAEVMTPIAKSLTVVWQDVNRQGSES